MNVKNVIVGTAGHVDHGKTCLIKALTGIDTDRLKEEKKRGITIENGFADLHYNGYNIGIIDVPGHEKFIKNMLAGIGGIDLVLLIIGLDEGVMPQTREHLQILNMLGIRRGIVVYTKRDMVSDEEWIELVKEDGRTLTAGTFLDGAPSIEVSAFDGYHIEELKQLITETIDDELLKNQDPALFRLPIDRVFTMDGFGTVVTGTLLEGQVNTGDEIAAYPEGRVCKVRNLQVHGQPVDCAVAGQRTAINLSGIKREELYRGQVLARAGAVSPSMMLDVKLELFDDTDREVKNGSRVHVYCGSSQVLGKVILLDRDSAVLGDACYAQLRLEEPLAVKREDRFIIRFYSPMITIGGGRVLDACPKKHKRRDDDVLQALAVKDQGSDIEVLELVILENSSMLLTEELLGARLRMPESRLKELLHQLLQDDRIRLIKKQYVMHAEYLQKAAACGTALLQDYHQQNVLSAGMPKEEFKSRLGQKLRIDDSKVIEDMLVYMEERLLIKISDKRVALYDFEIQYSQEMKEMRQRLLQYYRTCRFEMPTVDEVLDREKDKVNARHIIESLAEEGKLVRLDYQYSIDADAFQWAVHGLKRHIEENGQITLAEFRDLIGASRKFAIVILEYLDRQKVTKKVDDVRVLH